MKKVSPAKTLGPGLKRTSQRMAILDYLTGNTAHPSAEDVYRAVSKKYRSLSLATVYNTLNALTDAGAVRELTIDPARKRYDTDTSAHNHLICVSCRKILDAPGDISMDLPRGAASGFSVLGTHVEFYGHCPDCKKKKKRRKAF